LGAWCKRLRFQEIGNVLIISDSQIHPTRC
jgi:hypothetical protein